MSHYRHRLYLAYKGTHYHGWQRQPSALTVQEQIETAIRTVFRSEIGVQGCGRTDTGVHASNYYAHADFPRLLTERDRYAINALCGDDITIYAIDSCADDWHARFMAIERGYLYRLSTRENPFNRGLVSYYPRMELELDRLNEPASLLLNYQDFIPFRKTGSDNQTDRCDIRTAEWKYEASADEYHFHIRADRFLRGMVRLIVGGCIRYATGQLSIGEIRAALDEQRPLQGAWSADPEGLYLCSVVYPED